MDLNTIKYLLSAQCNKEQLVSYRSLFFIYFMESRYGKWIAEKYRLQTGSFDWTGSASLLSDLADRLISCVSIKSLTRRNFMLENKMQMQRGRA